MMPEEFVQRNEMDSCELFPVTCGLGWMVDQLCS